MKNTPVIDNEKCTMCGRCVEICPKDVLQKKGSAIEVLADECMLCSHCYCICPAGAVSFEPGVLMSPRFKTFRYGEKVAGIRKTDPAETVNLLRSRKSIRKYSDKPVPPDVIEDLVSCAVTAPSGSNSQNWNFLVINGREKVWDFGLEIGRFFEKINRLAENPLTRYGLYPVMGRTLIKYYADNYETVKWAIEEAARGRDLLFHGAPVLVIMHGTETEGSTPLEDAQYASYNMALLAHAMGLGTCLIGYATEALNRSGSLKKHLSVPAAHRVYAVLALGYTDLFFERLSLRKPYSIKYL